MRDKVAYASARREPLPDLPPVLGSDHMSQSLLMRILWLNLGAVVASGRDGDDRR
jgi:hypothetical protein